MIADICARLDGLPLAIELAAARTRAFPIQQIASRLNDRFRLLTGGSRTALPRQQTLRAVVDWSYELLFDDEQRVFERLSVFPGGCDLATAEAVCADDVARRRRISPTISTPSSTSRWSSPCRRATSCGSPSCRRWPSTAGSSSPNAATPCGSATRWRRTTPDLCAQSAAAYTGDDQRAWLTAIDQEHDNLRAALEWAVANDDAETALTIAGGASWPHWLAGTVVEGKRWLDDAFALRGRGERAHTGAGADGPRAASTSLPAHRSSVDDDLERGARDLPTPRRRRSRWRWRTRSTPSSRRGARRPRRRPAAAAWSVLDFYRELPDDPFVDRGARVLAGEARRPRRRPRRGRALLPSGRRRLRASTDR